MEGWAIVQRHVASEITLLCDQHHRERTSGLLPLAKVREADANPINRRSGQSRALRLHYSGKSASIELGSNRFESALLEGVREMHAVVIDGEPMIGFRLEDGHVLVSMSVYNVCGSLILQIVDNELQYRVDGAWDFQLIGQVLSIRMARGVIFMQVHFRVPDTLEVRRGVFMRNGVQINIDPGALSLVNSGTSWSQCVFSGMSHGIVVGTPRPLGSAAFNYPNPPRFVLADDGVFALKA